MARQSDVFVQSDGRFIIRGAHGREHVFSPEGIIITSLKRSNNAHQGRVRAGDRRPATIKEFDDFNELFPK